MLLHHHRERTLKTQTNTNEARPPRKTPVRRRSDDIALPPFVLDSLCVIWAHNPRRDFTISPAELCGSERVLGPTKRNQANTDCVSICEVLRTYKHDSLATTRQPGAGHRDDNGLPRATKWQGYWPPALSELASTRRGDVCRSGGAGLSHTRATFFLDVLALQTDDKTVRLDTPG